MAEQIAPGPSLIIKGIFCANYGCFSCSTRCLWDYKTEMNKEKVEKWKKYSCDQRVTGKSSYRWLSYYTSYYGHINRSMLMIFEWQGTKLVARSYKDSTDVLQAKYVAGDVNTPWGTKPNTEEEKNMVMSLSVPEHVYGKWWWGL